MDAVSGQVEQAGEAGEGCCEVPAVAEVGEDADGMR